MSHDQLKFWITCPDCKHVFGVEPRAIVQYLNRVLGALTTDAPPPTDAAPETPAGEAPPNVAPANQPASRKPPYRRGRPWQR